MNPQGLTSKQVQSKIAEGKSNRTSKKTTNSITKIILKNSLTIFNLVNLILAIMIILVGSYKNLLFILIAIANTLISIINEIRAKRTVDKMRLTTEQKPTVIRNGKTIQINQEDIVEGDLLIFSLGDQILVDCRLEEGAIEVNESFVTGEQDNVHSAHSGCILPDILLDAISVHFLSQASTVVPSGDAGQDIAEVAAQSAYAHQA